MIGSNGQLGTDLVRVLAQSHEVSGLTHKEIEVTSQESCSILTSLSPDAVINTAAFHKTDLCEDDPVKTFAVNAIGARNVALACRSIGATDVYISTDYVFDGEKRTPYIEEDTPFPINTYGISKLAGEFFTRQIPKHYVVRISSVFGVAGASGKGGNFVETMISKAKSKEQIKVVDDQWMSPTYTMDAALTIRSMLDMGIPPGIYHAANAGCCSWYEFTKAIMELSNMDPSVLPIKSSSFQTKARRPAFSALASSCLSRFGIPIRNWREALADYLVQKGHVPKSPASKPQPRQ